MFAQEISYLYEIGGVNYDKLVPVRPNHHRVGHDLACHLERSCVVHLSLFD